MRYINDAFAPKGDMLFGPFSFFARECGHFQSAAMGARQTGLDSQMEVTDTLFVTGASYSMILVYALGD